MILIADSGSTKTHWCLMTANGQSSDILTEGMNPVLQSKEAIAATVGEQLLPKIANLLWAGTVTHVFFYGAGCTPEKGPVVQQVLQTVFKQAQIEVASDMLGAARALMQHNRGIVCILGTGSGTCLWDGEQIEKTVPSLGFILGDEGGGAALGKRLVADIFKNQLGQEIKEQFLSEYSLTIGELIEKVYRQPMPNRYLASLSRFCADHLDNKKIYELVYDHFTDFVVRNLEQYYQDENDVEIENTANLKVGFVGSIAYYYQDVLRQVMEDMGFAIARIMQDPMEGLKKYHKADIVPTQV